MAEILYSSGEPIRSQGAESRCNRCEEMIRIGENAYWCRMSDGSTDWLCDDCLNRVEKASDYEAL